MPPLLPQAVGEAAGRFGLSSADAFSAGPQFEASTWGCPIQSQVEIKPPPNSAARSDCASECVARKARITQSFPARKFKIEISANAPWCSLSQTSLAQVAASTIRRPCAEIGVAAQWTSLVLALALICILNSRASGDRGRQKGDTEDDAEREWHSCAAVHTDAAAAAAVASNIGGGKTEKEEGKEEEEQEERGARRMWRNREAAGKKKGRNGR